MALFSADATAKAKEFQERALARIRHMRAAVEKTAGQAIAVAEVNGSLAGWGYANERWGDQPKDDVIGMRELKVMNVPADLAVGLGLLGFTFFGGMGKYEEHGLYLGIGSTGAFSYRLGAESGRRAWTKDQQSKGQQPATTGALPPPHIAGAAARTHHVEYAPAAR
jgi:hypothetical protein